MTPARPDQVGHESPDHVRRRMRVIWNPNSGRKGGIPTNRASRDSLLELMASHDLGEELRETETEADAIEATRDAVERGYDIVVAAGGDGTVRLVAKELLGTRSALGILPLGSVMNVARMVGLPRDLEESARVLRQGHVRRIDVGLVGDKVFLESGSVGLHAAVSRDIQKVDEGDYFAILRSMVTAFRYRPSRMTIELDDGRTIDRRALLVAVTLGPFLGAGFTVAPDAAIDDGLFDIRAFLHYSKRELILNFASIAFGRRAYVPHALTERASRVRISSHTPLPARADGEDLGTTPVLFEIRAGWLPGDRTRGSSHVGLTRVGSAVLRYGDPVPPYRLSQPRAWATSGPVSILAHHREELRRGVPVPDGDVPVHGVRDQA